MYLRTLAIAASLAATTALTAPAGAVAVTTVTPGTSYTFGGTIAAGSPFTDTTTFAGLVSGVTATLRYMYSGPVSSFQMSFGGTPFLINAGTSAGSDGFNSYTFTTTGSNNLVFTGTAGVPVNFSGTLTAVTAAVPEISTWAMMTLGFGALGYSLRRRRTSFSLA